MKLITARWVKQVNRMHLANNMEVNSTIVKEITILNKNSNNTPNSIKNIDVINS